VNAPYLAFSSARPDPPLLANEPMLDFQIFSSCELGLYAAIRIQWN
jgi:hypothetical protein